VSLLRIHFHMPSYSGRLFIAIKKTSHVCQLIWQSTSRNHNKSCKFSNIYEHTHIFPQLITVYRFGTLKAKWSIIVPSYKKDDKIDCSNYRGISLLSAIYKILFDILLSRLTPYADEIPGDHQCGFWRTGQLLIIYAAFVKYLRKNEIQWSKASAIYKLHESLWFNKEGGLV
jgi:hypothetical protein